MWWLAAALADPGAFAGTWVLAGATTEQAKVDAVIEEGAQRFNFAIRAIARSKIRKACAVDRTIVIGGADGKITIDYQGDNPRKVEAPSDGTEVPVLGSQVTYTVAGEMLTVDGKNEDGGKKSVYKLKGDAMTVKHRLSSSSLGDPPLEWVLNYNRK